MMRVNEVDVYINELYAYCYDELGPKVCAAAEAAIWKMYEVEFLKKYPELDPAYIPPVKTPRVFAKHQPPQRPKNAKGAPF